MAALIQQKTLKNKQKSPPVHTNELSNQFKWSESMIG